jgi:hypothetical protein
MCVHLVGTATLLRELSVHTVAHLRTSELRTVVNKVWQRQTIE